MDSPSIIPGFDADVYIVLDDFGQIGRVYREADEETTDKESLIRRLKEGQYGNPSRIVCFTTAKGYSRDATAAIALEINERAERSGEELSQGLQEFIEVWVSRSKRWTAA